MNEQINIKPAHYTKDDIDHSIPAHCPRFEHASDILGKRWTGLILRLLQSGPMRFSELESHTPKLSPRMLSQRLRELEEEQVMTEIGRASCRERV